MSLVGLDHGNAYFTYHIIEKRKEIYNMEGDRFKNAVESGNVSEVEQIIKEHNKELCEYRVELEIEEKELDRTTAIVQNLRKLCLLEQKRLDLEMEALNLMLG